MDLPTPFVIAGNIETGTTGGAIGAGESSIQVKLTGLARTLDNSLASAWDLFDDRATLESQLTALVRENVQRLMGVKLAEEAPTTSGAEA